MQIDSTTGQNVRLLFYSGMNEYPARFGKLLSLASTVHIRTLAYSTVKVPSKEENAMNPVEKKVVFNCNAEHREERSPDYSGLSLVQQA